MTGATRRSDKLIATGLFAVLCLVSAAAPADAHHALTVIDRNKTLEMNGVVKAWEWTNPHTWLMLQVTGKNGKTATWSIEGLAPATLRLKNWSRLMMKPGDKVTITMHPRRDGTSGGMLVNVLASDGRYYAGFSGAPPSGAPAQP